MKPDQERVKNLLTDTVTLLCKNGLTFQDELRIEGLMAITVDETDIFVVHLNEKFVGEAAEPAKGTEETALESTVDLTDKWSTHSPRTPVQRPPGLRQTQPNRTALQHRQSPVHKSAAAGQPSPSSHSHYIENSATHPSDEHSRTSSPLDIKIKTESHDDDDLILVETEKSRHLRPSGSILSSDRSHRVPPIGQDDAEAMRQGYSNEGSYSQYDLGSRTDGESPAKRRRTGDMSGSDYGGENSSSGDGGYITGLVRNVHDGNYTADIASHVAHATVSQAGEGQLPSFETLAGCSSWPTASAGQMPGSQPTDMQYGLPGASTDHQGAWGGAGPVYVPRRSGRNDRDKPYQCGVNGCGKTFYHMPSLCRHKRVAHGLGRSHHSLLSHVQMNS